MSFQAYVYVEDWSVVDEPMPLLVQLQMANRANKDTGIIEASHADLAADCRFKSPSAVERHIAYLVKIGEVELVEPGGRGRGRRAKYRFPRMERPPTPAERAEAAKNPPRRAFSETTTPSGGNGKDLPGGLLATDGAAGKDLEKTSKSPPGRVAIGTPLLNLQPLPEGSSSLSGKSDAADQARRREPRRQDKQATPVRAPDDPVVLARVAAIRATQGNDRAAAYLRTVEATWARARASQLLAGELGRHIGQMP